MKNIIFLILGVIPFVSFSQTTYSAVGVSATFGDILKSYGKSEQIAYHAISIKEGTVGFPYVLRDWGSGKVIFNGQEIKETGLSLNFDKTKGLLLYKKDENTVLEIDMAKVERFTLNDPTTGEQTFIKATAFGENGYAQEIYSDNEYHLFKTINCRFKAADFKSNGMFTSGNDYDEYIDENHYIIVTPKGEITKIESLSNREIKNLASEFPQQASYIKSNMGSENKEAFLVQLLTTLATAN